MKDIIKNSSITFRYQLLSRLKMDCNYYLGNGNRYKNLCGVKMKTNK